jgi:hypothetical protein
MNRHTATLVKNIEAFIQRFVTLADSAYTLPLALWVINTYLWEQFDVCPYLVVTAATKQSGKTRLAEILSFMSRNSSFSGSMTAAAMYTEIERRKPTLFMDEAEALSSEAQSRLTAILNSGYRKGQTVKVLRGAEVEEFSTYGPKVFILIGDVRDTLRDRSIVVYMKRGEPKERFKYDAVKAEGAAIGAEIEALGTLKRELLYIAYSDFEGLDFLTDRDEELWTPLFVIASLLCPERIAELKRIAVDMATEKTQDARRYVNMQEAEGAALDDQYAKRLIRDLLTCFNGSHPNLSSAEAVKRLRDLDLGPWRKFRGEGITQNSLADMLSRFGLAPVNVRTGKGRKDNPILKGYKKTDVQRALKGHGLLEDFAKLKG